MNRFGSLLPMLALLTAPALAHAVPVTYSFDLTVRELSVGPNNAFDPYYAQFHLGQQFQGTLTYDPDDARPISHSDDYYNAFQYSVRIGDALIGTSSASGDPLFFFRPHTGAVDRPAGTNNDGFRMFDEVPVVQDGVFGSVVGYVEQIYMDLWNGSDDAVVGGPLGKVDFSLFAGSLWNFWWQPANPPGTPAYSRLTMSGTIDNVREGPEPGALALSLVALAGFAVARIARARATGGARKV
jgi:hypothetical protein